VNVVTTTGDSSLFFIVTFQTLPFSELETDNGLQDVEI